MQYDRYKQKNNFVFLHAKMFSSAPSHSKFPKILQNAELCAVFNFIDLG
jgi:hypothetical protein